METPCGGSQLTEVRDRKSEINVVIEQPRSLRRSLLKVFLEQRPIVGLPAFREMIALVLWKAGVLENQVRPRPFCLQIEPYHGIDPFRPRHHAPNLYDSLIRNQFHIPADNVAAEQRERTANFASDLGRLPGERTELFGVQQRLINLFGACLEIDFLVNRVRWRCCGWRRRCRRHECLG